MEVKITEAAKVDKYNHIELSHLGEGVVLINYKRNIFGHGGQCMTAEIVSLLKKDNPSLMVTAIEAFVTSGYTTGVIVNFEEKH